MSENQGNLCKNCRHRFRRIFIPIYSEEYKDDVGNILTADKDSIIIMNQCLVMGIDIGEESTVDCSHFEPVVKDESENFSLLNI